MTHLTDAEIDALDAMEKAATPGDWRYLYAGKCKEPHTVMGPTSSDGSATSIAHTPWDRHDEAATFMFIAAARNAMPALLAMARRLREIERSWGLSKEAGAKAKGGIASIMGKWPGDETDEQVNAALKEMG